jgi:PhoPQ-activated pathogenicity-related protein
MTRSRTLALFALYCFVPVFAVTARGAEPARKLTPLDQYVALRDPTYSWKLVKTIPGQGFTTFVLDLKSQSWRQSPEVDRAVWQHFLVITKPDEVKHETAFLMIGGGKNGGEPPAQSIDASALIARNTHSVVADLGMVPNQPLILDGDGKARSEDDLIAATWVKFMKTGDPTCLVRFAMVKSAVRAMDAVTEFLASETGGKTAIKKFVVAGGSKRGWTTWLTGAVDPRVVAVVPIVIDVLNVRTCGIHHYEAYGFFAQAIGDYTRHGIFKWMDSPQYADLLRIEDPYSYRDRLTMPKFIVNASGDQYFPPDSSQFYYQDLPGVKYLRYVPNANHSLRDTDARQSIMAFYRAVLQGAKLPKFTWKMEADGSIRVRADDKPREVNLWQATNPKARDFRLETLGPAYTKTALKSPGDGVYVGKVTTPEQGWTAFFVELVFDSGDQVPYKFTTQVRVVPEKLPYSIEELRKSLK